MTSSRTVRPNWTHRLFTRVIARDLTAFVVPGADVARAAGLDVERAGLRVSPTPRHANVLLVVGPLPDGLARAAAVAYAQMPRPRGIMCTGVPSIAHLPEPNVVTSYDQEDFVKGAGRLRQIIVANAWSAAPPPFLPPIDETAATSDMGMDHGGMHGGHAGHDPLASSTPDKHEMPHHDDTSAASHRNHTGHDMSAGQPGHQTTPREPSEQAAGSRDPMMDDHAQHDPVLDNGGHAMDHSGHTMADGEQAMDHSSHMMMDHSGHGGGFMSMIAMTEGLPRSRDGLQMEWMDVPFGPLFPGLPGGLGLTLTLDGDTVARARVVPGVARRHLEMEWPGPSTTLPSRFADLDRLAPGAYTVLAWQAIASADGNTTSDALLRARVGALEHARAISHLGWLTAFGNLLGYQWLADKAAAIQLALIHAKSIEQITPMQDAARRMTERVHRTPMLRQRLRGKGVLASEQSHRLRGPVARASGSAVDARASDLAYQQFGFAPVTRPGADALARMDVRLAEIIQSLGLVMTAGMFTLPEAREAPMDASEAMATLEMPRGEAMAHVVLSQGQVTAVHLTTPSRAHMDLVPEVARDAELADALVAIASLDISPWEADL